MSSSLQALAPPDGAGEQPLFRTAMAKARASGGAREGVKRTSAQGAPLLNDTVVLNNLFPPMAMVFVGAQGPRPDGIDDVVSAVQAQLEQLQDQATSAIAAAQQVSGDSESFIQQMNDAKAAAKKQMDATIDDAYNHLTQIGDQDPEAQPLIVQAMGELSTLVSATEGAISGAFDGAIGAAQDAIDAIASAAESAADAIANAATVAANAVASIFSGW
jgi:hypothetical protein